LARIDRAWERAGDRLCDLRERTRDRVDNKHQLHGDGTDREYRVPVFRHRDRCRGLLGSIKSDFGDDATGRQSAAIASTKRRQPYAEFSPYIDMAMSQDADLVAISKASGIENFTLAFVLASDHGIGWQGTGTISQDTLVNGSTILAQVQAIQAAGGDITISFGGAAGQEAALTATSASALQAEYQSVIDRYHVNSIDFDIEGAAVQDQHSITLRDQALAGLEKENPN
jgi:RecJ-like exonuclease